MERCYIIICRDDMGDYGKRGGYVLATRITFNTRSDADLYVSGIAHGRHAIVVECPNGLLYRQYECVYCGRKSDDRKLKINCPLRQRGKCIFAHDLP